MSALMFAVVRELVIASLPPNLPPDEFKRQLIEGIYGSTLQGALNNDCQTDD